MHLTRTWLNTILIGRIVFEGHFECPKLCPCSVKTLGSYWVSLWIAKKDFLGVLASSQIMKKLFNDTTVIPTLVFFVAQLIFRFGNTLGAVLQKSLAFGPAGILQLGNSAVYSLSVGFKCFLMFIPKTGQNNLVDQYFLEMDWIHQLYILHAPCMEHLPTFTMDLSYV